jgi:hypothetical protein
MEIRSHENSVTAAAAGTGTLHILFYKNIIKIRSTF